MSHPPNRCLVWLRAVSLALALAAAEASAQAPDTKPVQKLQEVLTSRTSPGRLGASDAFGQRVKLALSAEANREPDFLNLESPAVEQALRSPQTLWDLLTSPQTPYHERRAAAAQAQGVFPPSWFRRVLAVLDEIEQKRAHLWGLEPHPLWAAVVLPERVPSGVRVRQLLGKEWIVTRPEPYPITWEEKTRAPWPWQVNETLRRLPDKAYVGTKEDWLTTIVGLPCANDDEARLFHRASASRRNVRTVEIVGAWRNIAFNPAMERTAYQQGRELAGLVRTWNHAEARWISYAALLDVLEKSPHKRARDQAAYWIQELRGQSDRRTHQRQYPEPASAILTVGTMASDRNSGHAWHRLYNYAFSVLEASDDPPFPPDRHMGSNSPEVGPSLKRFETWFANHRERLEVLAEEEHPHLEEARKLLIGVELCAP